MMKILQITQVAATDKPQCKGPTSKPPGALFESLRHTGWEPMVQFLWNWRSGASNYCRCDILFQAWYKLSVGDMVNGCWPSPAKWFLVPSSAGLVTILDCKLGRERTSPSYHYDASPTFRPDDRKWSTGGRKWRQEPELDYWSRWYSGLNKTEITQLQ
jgi:hypothetical protein